MTRSGKRRQQNLAQLRKKEDKQREARAEKAHRKGAKPAAGVTALPNMGSTCYFNSALQLLIRIDPFVSAAVDDSVTPAQGLDKGKEAYYKAIRELFNAMLTNDGGIFEPKAFYKTFCKQYPQFRPMSQGDAQEVVSILIRDVLQFTNPLEGQKMGNYDDDDPNPETHYAAYRAALAQKTASPCEEDLEVTEMNVTECWKCGARSISFASGGGLTLELPLGQERGERGAGGARGVHGDGGEEEDEEPATVRFVVILPAPLSKPGSPVIRKKCLYGFTLPWSECQEERVREILYTLLTKECYFGRRTVAKTVNGVVTHSVAVDARDVFWERHVVSAASVEFGCVGLAQICDKIRRCNEGEYLEAEEVVCSGEGEPSPADLAGEGAGAAEGAEGAEGVEGVEGSPAEKASVAPHEVPASKEAEKFDILLRYNRIHFGSPHAVILTACDASEPAKFYGRHFVPSEGAGAAVGQQAGSLAKAPAKAPEDSPAEAPVEEMPPSASAGPAAPSLPESSAAFTDAYVELRIVNGGEASSFAAVPFPVPACLAAPAEAGVEVAASVPAASHASSDGPSSAAQSSPSSSPVTLAPKPGAWKVLFLQRLAPLFSVLSNRPHELVPWSDALTVQAEVREGTLCIICTADANALERAETAEMGEPAAMAARDAAAEGPRPPSSVASASASAHPAAARARGSRPPLALDVFGAIRGLQDFVLPRNLSLDDCLRAHSRKSRVDGWRCRSCGQEEYGLHYTELYTTGEYLVIHLKRFVESLDPRTYEPVYKKMGARVGYPVRGLTIRARDTAGWRSPGDAARDQVYDLLGVVQHYGSRVDSGHYTCLSLLDEGWVEINDDQVYTTEEEHVVSPAAYVLLYRRRRSEGA